MSKSRAPREEELHAPAQLRSERIRLGGAEYLILSHSLPEWNLPSSLTPAERDVVRAILDGASRREVAQRRGTSPRTVSNLLAQAFRKLGVRSRMELAVKLAGASREVSKM